MKKLLIVLAILFSAQASFGQQAGKFRMGLDLGPAIPDGGGLGFLVNLEPKINIANNMNVGLRFGVAALAKEVTTINDFEEYQGEVSANASISGTFDYYFNNGGSNFAPYIGVGYGYFTLSAVEFDSSSPSAPDFDNLDADFKWAPIVRAGIELGKFRMGAEYNFVPVSNLQDTSGNIIGEALNQYFGFTLGFYVGGGRWRGL
ncbi:Outer membrane protein W [Algoriphagus ornithinivorans]|uniref:Outer membrane protein W n=1 Tax=Algoriphagus ornithinivorans TaxID=226506 RepID=A0A1I5IKD3_9BACT|nr:outer membrane beta-barrel protein [Algoriphagus ornithinivorans]SFO60993.1 Outer membrane protein W [Algoriphagus ornithinivorans]